MLFFNYKNSMTKISDRQLLQLSPEEVSLPLKFKSMQPLVFYLSFNIFIFSLIGKFLSLKIDYRFAEAVLTSGPD